MENLLNPAPRLITPAPLTATGPLGLCYHCVIARKSDPARAVSEAITLAPVSVQISDALGQPVGVAIVALPHCNACLAGGTSLLVTG